MVFGRGVGTTMNDSGMSDSQFMKFQKKTQERINKYVDNYNKDIRIDTLKRRFALSKKQTLWERIKSWIIK